MGGWLGGWLENWRVIPISAFNYVIVEVVAEIGNMENRDIMKCMEEYRKGGKIGISIIIIIFSFFLPSLTQVWARLTLPRPS